MVRGLYTAWTGMVNEQKRLDVISNNMANADTIGYKKQNVTSQSFDDELTLRIHNNNAYSPLNYRIGNMNLGVKIGETYHDLTQGSLRETGNTYDLALSGDGFFTIQTTNKQGVTSVKYTRDGSFTVNTEGYLVTKDGDYVLDRNGGRIRIPGAQTATEVTFDEQGNISVGGRRIAVLGIAGFANPQALLLYGENMYEATAAAGLQAGTAAVHQGYVEMSNTNVIEEMVDMITITRAYEAGQKMIQTVDNTLDNAVNQIGRV
ncbi:MAG: flagellar basal-body rod protein FlgF [Bacteroidales bacterium]|nr:flagellar basal-body rod protein FlgF [Clostridium sp.]MCM1203814.1 flagellar basal-body rod protein FlgF [Bacteroidales bacterium]